MRRVYLARFLASTIQGVKARKAATINPNCPHDLEILQPWRAVILKMDLTVLQIDFWDDFTGHDLHFFCVFPVRRHDFQSRICGFLTGFNNFKFPRTIIAFLRTSDFKSAIYRNFKRTDFASGKSKMVLRET